ncbi:MAG: amino acid adenylation domain-containing protein [Thiotrichaceae bacterium]
MLASRLLNSFQKHLDKPALWIAGTTYSYRELQDAVRSMLIALQHTPDTTVVAILTEHSLTAYAGILASAISGRTYLPLNVEYPDERLLKILERAQPGAVILEQSQLERASRVFSHVDKSMTLIMPNCDDKTDMPKTLAHHQWVNITTTESVTIEKAYASEDDLSKSLYLIFTSGTTGEPKGILINRRNVLDYLDAIKQLFDFGPDDRFSQFFTLSFDLSVHDMFVTWTTGACLYVPSRSERIDPVGFARRHRLTVWFSVPSLATLSIRSRKLKPDSLPVLRHALFCGEALSCGVAEAFAQAAPNAALTNLYGPTEATIAITSHRFQGAADLTADSVPIGHAFPSQETLVLDKNLVLVAPGKIGELWLGGTQIASGYMNDKAQTEAKFCHFSYPGYQSSLWYQTGDLVEQRPGIGLIYRGRKDEQIKLHGHRIEITEVEQTLQKAAGTPLAIILTWPVDRSQVTQHLIALVCNSQHRMEDIRREMERYLPLFMVPARIIPVKEMVFNVNQKLDRKQIINRYQENIIGVENANNKQ